MVVIHYDTLLEQKQKFNLQNQIDQYRFCKFGTDKNLVSSI